MAYNKQFLLVGYKIPNEALRLKGWYDVVKYGDNEGPPFKAPRSEVLLAMPGTNIWTDISGSSEDSDVLDLWCIEVEKAIRVLMGTWLPSGLDFEVAWHYPEADLLSLEFYVRLKVFGDREGVTEVSVVDLRSVTVLGHILQDQVFPECLECFGKWNLSVYALSGPEW